MSKFLCTFKFGDHCKHVSDRPEIGLSGLDAFKDGFWLDSDYNLSSAFSGFMWIPPWQIECVTKTAAPPPPEDPEGVA